MAPKGQKSREELKRRREEIDGEMAEVARQVKRLREAGRRAERRDEDQ